MPKPCTRKCSVLLNGPFATPFPPQLAHSSLCCWSSFIKFRFDHGFSCLEDLSGSSLPTRPSPDTEHSTRILISQVGPLESRLPDRIQSAGDLRSNAWEREGEGSRSRQEEAATDWHQGLTTGERKRIGGGEPVSVMQLCWRLSQPSRERRSLDCPFPEFHFGQQRTGLAPGLCSAVGR